MHLCNFGGSELCICMHKKKTNGFCLWYGKDEMKINWIRTITWVCFYWRKHQLQIGVDKEDDGQQVFCKSHLYDRSHLLIFYAVRLSLLVEFLIIVWTIKKVQLNVHWSLQLL